jgi:hypothetical protein
MLWTLLEEIFVVSDRCEDCCHISIQEREHIVVMFTVILSWYSLRLPWTLCFAAKHSGGTCCHFLQRTSAVPSDTVLLNV